MSRMMMRWILINHIVMKMLMIKKNTIKNLKTREIEKTVLILKARMMIVMMAVMTEMMMTVMMIID